MKERTSVVTGGTGGLGTAVVRALVERGDRVWVPWIENDERDRLAESLDPGAPVTFVRTDVTDVGDLTALVERLDREHGVVDVLCNLVGGFTMAPLIDTSDAAWDHMMSLNARSVFAVTRALTPLLVRSTRGRIVNVASAPALRGGGAGMAAYTASKGAVVALTRALAGEFADEGITVNAVAPTTIDTPANRRAMPEADDSRWVTPAEIASLMAWLTSDDARVVTGNVVVAGR